MRAGQLVYGTDDLLDHLARETRRSSEQRPEPPILPEPKPEPDGDGRPGSRTDRFAAGGLRRRRCGRRGGKLAGGESLAVCGDDLRALLALGLGLCLGLAGARFMLSGSWMSFSSTTVISMPRSSVWTSRISRMFSLLVPVSDSVHQACGARRRHAAWSGRSG
jgi:hypothetical protein